MTLKELYEKIKEKNSLLNKLDELYSQKQQWEEQVYYLQERLNKEERDVQRLEANGLSSFFFNMMGNKEERLEKERREAYEAKMKYDSALYQLNSVNSLITRLEAQLKEIEQYEKEYEIKLNEQITLLKESNPELLKMQEAIFTCKHMQKELQEAINAGEDALDIADEVAERLDRARGWSTMDMLGGGLITDMAKYSHLDEAEYLIQQLQAQLGRFKSELADVKLTLQLNINIDSFLRMADYFFDNVFTDFAVMDKITRAQDQIYNVGGQIDAIINKLMVSLEVEREKESQLQEKLAKFVIEKEV